ncbi:hypothetical protein ACM61V_01375 [Sphingomonas sp. TX0543]|uniref:hypothetical protein n=1 Tax=unclassified Sphingomonas TaxID=196159 RepID=UPI0010F5477D|nr:hypothetical protein [Sphingomonas sp. 3P27F8]
MTRAGEIAARIGKARALVVAARVAAAAGAALPGVRVAREGATVTITGRGVLSRLRWPGGLGR